MGRRGRFISKGKSRKMFRKGAQKVHSLNFARALRGGIRL